MALRTSSWLPFSIGAGFFLSLVILGGSVQEGMFVSLFIGYLLFSHLLGKNLFQRAQKIAIVGTIIVIFFLGFSAIKLIPTLELLKVDATRESGFSYEQLVGDGTINTSNLLSLLISNVGIFGVLLLPFVFFGIKQRKTFLICSIALFSLLILTKNPFIHLLWTHAPLISKMRGIYKVLFLFIFPLSILIGLAASNLLEFLKHKFKSPLVQTSRFQQGAISLLCVAFIINLAIFGPQQDSFDSLSSQLEKNQILQFMSKELTETKELFRFKMYETNGIDWGTDFYSVPLGLQDIYGYDNVWNNRYMPTFLSIANNDPSKFFGMLNMKYLTSMNPLNISGFTLVRKFDECGLYPNGIDICQPRKSDGPYLYRNDGYLSRSYIVDHAILVLGSLDKTRNVIFFIMLQKQYDPTTTVILESESLSTLSFPLDALDTIIIATAPQPQDSQILKSYVDKGKTLVPNFFEGENQLSEEKIIQSIPKTNVSVSKPIDFLYTSDNKATALLNATGKFLILSEQFSLYPGWKASQDGHDLPLYTASTILTAVYIGEKNGEVSFVYFPFSVKKAILISASFFSIAAALLMGYWFRYLKKRELKTSSL
jgi:hypothetical protein